MLTLQIMIYLTIFTHATRRGIGLSHTTSPPSDLCVELEFITSNSTHVNSMQTSECSNLTIPAYETAVCQSMNYSQEIFRNTSDLGYDFNRSETCLVLQFKNSSVCHVLDEAIMCAFASHSWVNAIKSSNATCNQHNASFSVCFPNRKMMCDCHQWYKFEPDYVFQGSCSNASSYLFSTSLSEIEKSNSLQISECKTKRNVLEEIRVIVMLALAGISVASLLLSVTIHLLLFRSSHDVLPLLFHKITLLVTYVSFLLRSFRTYSEEIVCIYGALYFAGECTFLASFFWLNVLAYEMWRQFHPKHVFQRTLHHFQWTKLFLQSLYGWGGSAVFMMIYCLLHLISDNQLFIYRGNCPIFFTRNTTQVIFIAAVNEVALFISIALFTSTVINMKKIKASVAQANSNKRMFWTYVKLMTLAAFSAAFYVLKNAIPPKGMEQMYWVPADLLISLHGFLLLLLDCTNSNVRRWLKSGLLCIGSSFCKN